MTKEYFEKSWQSYIATNTVPLPTEQVQRSVRGVEKLARILINLSGKERKLVDAHSADFLYDDYIGCLNTEYEGTQPELMASIRVQYASKIVTQTTVNAKWFQQRRTHHVFVPTDELVGIDVSIEPYHDAVPSFTRIVDESCEAPTDSSDNIARVELTLAGIAEMKNYHYRPVEQTFTDPY